MTAARPGISVGTAASVREHGHPDNEQEDRKQYYDHQEEAVDRIASALVFHAAS
jgi:hypothetical protein